MSGASTGIERAASLLAGARHAVALVGAGLSAESGVPTFRGTGGLWTRFGEPTIDGWELFGRDPGAWWEAALAHDAAGNEFAAALDAERRQQGPRGPLHGVPLDHINPWDVRGSDAGNVSTATAMASAPAKGDGAAPAFDYAVRAMLFADAVGYSRLSEDQVPLFFEHYLGAIAAFNAVTLHRPEHVETAGDGMYLVFRSPAAAGLYALGLSELINRKDWAAVGLPRDMGVRIGLHCGPVFIGRDPITGKPLYTGIHTSRTARIEPITPPGQVYASGAFAAVAAARGVEGMRFSYIGRTQLAKQYGALALYHVKRP